MMSADMLLLITCYAIGINLAGFLIFSLDKHRARNGMWRISESNLLALAIFGGTIGVIVAQRTLRHKTRKEPFRTFLLLIVAVQIILLLALSIPEGRHALWTLILLGLEG